MIVEVRDMVLDALREGINASVMTTIIKVEAYRHDSLMLLLGDGRRVTLRITEIDATTEED